LVAKYLIGCQEEIMNSLVLAYHSVGDGRYFSDTLTMSKESLEKEIQFLLKNRYEFITFSELSKVHGNESGKKYVCLTFDDGYLDNYTVLFPLLKKYNITATLFVTTDFIDNKLTKVTEKHPNRKSMSWKQLNEIKQYGVEIGSHTVAHHDLDKLSDAELEFELVQSKKIIDEKLKQNTKSFCYPRNIYGKREILAVDAAGYDIACATQTNKNNKIRESKYEFRRVGVYPNTNIFKFYFKCIFRAPILDVRK
jgi:peptidoglycan/xylan/chitin deacetylase (PgdA/CDA1 family)